MKKLLLFILCLGIYEAVQGQTSIESPTIRTVVIYTNDAASLPIRINVNGSYAGDITHADIASTGRTRGSIVVKVSSGTNNIVRALYPNGTEWYSSIPPSTERRQYFEVPPQRPVVQQQPAETQSRSGVTITAPGNGATAVPQTQEGLAQAAGGAALVVGGAAAAYGLIYGMTDIYVGFLPPVGFNRGYLYGFGLRNSLNSLIDVELLAHFRGDKENENIKPFGIGINMLYNVKQRWIGRKEPVVNPYFGFTLVDIPSAATGPIVGFSVRTGRWKYHLRYRYLHDFVKSKPYGNFVEVGISFTYKYQFKFRP